MCDSTEQRDGRNSGGDRDQFRANSANAADPVDCARHSLCICSVHPAPHDGTRRGVRFGKRGLRSRSVSHELRERHRSGALRTTFIVHLLGTPRAARRNSARSANRGSARSDRAQFRPSGVERVWNGADPVGIVQCDLSAAPSAVEVGTALNVMTNQIDPNSCFAQICADRTGPLLGFTVPHRHTAPTPFPLGSARRRRSAPLSAAQRRSAGLSAQPTQREEGKPTPNDPIRPDSSDSALDTPPQSPHAQSG